MNGTTYKFSSIILCETCLSFSLEGQRKKQTLNSHRGGLLARTAANHFDSCSRLASFDMNRIYMLAIMPQRSLNEKISLTKCPGRLNRLSPAVEIR